MNTNERPTPETDAVTADKPKHASVINGVVPAFFARCLERQRDEARDRIAELEKQLAGLQKPKEPKEQDTFKAHGLTWMKHTPGDPRPCDACTRVVVILSSGEVCGDYMNPPYNAMDLDWSVELPMDCRIIGWNYAECSSEIAQKEVKTFKSHGLTWIEHKPIYGMPCDPNSVVRVLMACESIKSNADYFNVRKIAKEWFWFAEQGPFVIVGWNHADVRE